jgi:predicted ATPase
MPELLRIKGAILAASSADGTDYWQQSLEIAGQQSALSWELRTAIGLAQLRISEDRRDEARTMLASVFDRFTEGFATREYQVAERLLSELGDPVRKT